MVWHFWYVDDEKIAYAWYDLTVGVVVAMPLFLIDCVNYYLRMLCSIKFMFFSCTFAHWSENRRGKKLQHIVRMHLHCDWQGQVFKCTCWSALSLTVRIIAWQQQQQQQKYDIHNHNRKIVCICKCVFIA